MQKNILLLILLSFILHAETEFPEIKNHWLRAAPTGAMMLAAYAELDNNSDAEKILIGAYSPDFKLVEIHQTMIQDGMAKMVQQRELRIKPHTQLMFQPGGLHIMLMQPKKQIVEGDKVKICLIYQQGDSTSVQHIFFPVEKK